jgi:hypothetical protein
MERINTEFSLMDGCKTFISGVIKYDQTQTKCFWSCDWNFQVPVVRLLQGEESVTVKLVPVMNSYCGFTSAFGFDYIFVLSTVKNDKQKLSLSVEQRNKAEGESNV